MARPVVYELTVPVLTKALQNQAQILETAKAWCADNAHDVAMLSTMQLVPDMFGLPFHSQFCTYTAVQLLIELGVTDAPGLSIAPSEMPVDELIAQISSTVQLLEKATPDKFVGKEGMDVQVKSGRISFTRNAVQYAQEVAMPSFWFHHGMVYSILRLKGVPLTKQLFLSAN